MLGDQEAPAAAALVFDTNPRMQYRQQNRSRLEIAQETAQWLLPQFPPESDVAIVDSHAASAAFAGGAGGGAAVVASVRKICCAITLFDSLFTSRTTS